MLELTKDNFEAEVLEASGLVLVDFWGNGCAACEALMPSVVELSEEYGDKIKFTKLNTTGSRRLAIKQKVLGLPTVTIYSEGKKLAELTKDDATKENIRSVIEEIL